MPAMNASEMTMPSGFSTTLSTKRVDEDQRDDREPDDPARLPRRRADTVTANAAEIIIARIPVA